MEDEFADAVMENLNLDEADLSGQDLRGARLPKNFLGRADLSCTVLRGAALRESLQAGAEIAVANLERADLGGADPEDDAALQGEWLAGAEFGDALHCGADLPAEHELGSR